MKILKNILQWGKILGVILAGMAAISLVVSLLWNWSIAKVITVCDPINVFEAFWLVCLMVIVNIITNAKGRKDGP